MFSPGDKVKLTKTDVALRHQFEGIVLQSSNNNTVIGCKAPPWLRYGDDRVRVVAPNNFIRLVNESTTEDAVA